MKRWRCCEQWLRAVSPANDSIVPHSLADPGLAPLWSAVRRRLDRSDTARGTIRMPEIDPQCRPALAALIDRQPAARLDLADLEAGLMRLGIGDDLTTSLNVLGFPPDPAIVKQREARDRGQRVRMSLASTLLDWPEAWAGEWGQGLVSSGLLSDVDEDAAVALLDDVRKLLDWHGSVHRADPPDRLVLRTELAAQLFGSAHALDPQTKLASAVERALRNVTESRNDAPRRDLWEAVGIAADSVSAPVLTWGLRPGGSSALSPLFAAAADASVPLHVSLRALRAHPIEVAEGAPVLVVENPSMVEHAADISFGFALVCTNGNPTSAVIELVDQLAASGAHLRYHGDFDAAGIKICRRMSERGCAPWRMSAADYLGAVRRAQAQRVPLPRDDACAGPTPWDPALEAAFDDCRLIVHEELVVAEALREFGA